MRIGNRAGDASDATCLGDGLEPGLLLGPDAACCGCLDLDAGEDCQACADHGLSNGDGAPADQVSAALGQAEGDEPTGAWIGQAAHLIAEDAGVGVGAKGKADLLLEDGLGISHAPRAKSPCNSAAALQ